MDIVIFPRLHQIVRNHNGGVRNHLGAFELGCAQQAGLTALAGLVGIIVRGDFNLIERHRIVLISPVLSPKGHHIAHPLNEGVVQTHIGAALIPDEALGGIALNRMLHPVVHHIRLAPLACGNRFGRQILVPVCLQHSLRKPALDPGPSACEGNDAYRHIQHFLQPAGKKEGGSAHPSGVLRKRVLPAGAVCNIIQNLL